jgi:hypothetical protein
MTSEGGEYGAIPLITDSGGNTLVSVDQRWAAHAERDIKPKVRQGASAVREDPDKGKTFQGYHIVEPEERPWGGRELYRMEEDEGLPEMALVFEEDESMLVEEQGPEGVAYDDYRGGDAMYERGGGDGAYERGGAHAGCSDYDMEVRPRYNPGYRRRGPPTRPPEFFQTIPTLAPPSRSVRGASGAYRASAPPVVSRNRAEVGAATPDPHRRSHEPRQTSNGPTRAPSFPREIQRVDRPRIRSSSRDIARTHQGVPVAQVQGQSNAPGGPSRSIIPPTQPTARSFVRLAQSLRQEQEEGVTYYRRDGAVGGSNDAYSIAQEAKANRRRYGS